MGYPDADTKIQHKLSITNEDGSDSSEIVAWGPGAPPAVSDTESGAFGVNASGPFSRFYTAANAAEPGALPQRGLCRASGSVVITGADVAATVTEEQLGFPLAATDAVVVSVSGATGAIGTARSAANDGDLVITLSAAPAGADTTTVSYWIP